MTDEYRYPFSPYPEGWFAILEASELAEGELKSLEYFGRELVAFRGADGAIKVMDAHCAHQGAHLGHGGKLEDGCLRCPFPGWKYDGEGRCVDEPYSKEIPSNARQHSYPVIVWANLVIVFYQAQNLPPSWRPELPDLDGSWSVYGRNAFKVKVHIQDVGENGVDIPHFKYVHDTVMPDLVRAEGIETTFYIETATRKDSPHYQHLRGIKRQLWGMGISSSDFVGQLTGRVIICRTPIDALYSELSIVAVPPKLPSEKATAAFGKALLERVSEEIQSDIPVWEHKKYAENPLLVRGDGPISRWRRWCKQFYTEDLSQAPATSRGRGKKKVSLPVANDAC